MNKFKVGDKVVRKTNCCGADGRLLIADGHVGVVTSVNDDWISVDGITYRDDAHPFAYIHFDLVEEKEMFDMKTTPWYVTVNNEEESKAFQAWAFENGFRWNGTGDCYLELSVAGYPATIGSHGSCWNKRMVYGIAPSDIGERKEVFFTYKTTVESVTYPEVLSEKEIETRKIREEMEKLAERLKKLESE